MHHPACSHQFKKGIALIPIFQHTDPPPSHKLIITGYTLAPCYKCKFCGASYQSTPQIIHPKQPTK